LYHAAIGELNCLQTNEQQALPAEAWNYLRVKLDSQIVSESQRLNHNMVLLTIAIAGGPFLGLLGTVVGVMITFAAIAASGDVNINSIAPGIAAALLATVAGLAVAIPSLFAYNYLLTQIKNITAGMRIFADEFLALLAMRAARQHNGESA
jgi:biopolymer transport protein ExbB